MKKSIKTTAFCVFIIIVGLLTVVGITASTTNFSEATNASIVSSENVSPTSNSYFELENANQVFSANGNIFLTYSLNSESVISSVNYTQSGFSSLDVNVDTSDSKSFTVNAAAVSNSQNYHIAFQATLASGEIVYTDLYAVKNTVGTFVSQFSYENAYYKYLKYAKDENIISEKEYEDLLGEFTRRDINEIPLSEISNFNTNIENTELSTAAASNLAYAEGQLQWKDA